MKTVFGRELRALIRRPAIHVLITSLLLGMVLIVAGVWPDAANLGPEEIAREGSEGWQGAMRFELFLLLLLAPAIGAPSILTERQSGTLLLVMLSGITPWSFASAKLGARFCIVGLIVLLPFPIFTALSQLGGTDMHGSVLTALVLVTTALFTTSLAVCLSAVVRQAYQAVLATWAFLTLVLFVPILLPSLGLTESAIVTGRYGIWEAVISPARNLDYIFSPTSFGTAGLSAELAWVQPTVYLLLSALLLAVTSGLVQRSLHEPPPAKAGFGLKLLDRFLSLGNWRRKVSANPIYWRETSLQGLLRMRGVHRFSVVVLLLNVLLIIAWRFPEGAAVLKSFGAYVPTSTGSPTLRMHAAVQGVFMALVMLSATVAAVVSISSERQTGLLMQMAATPLRFETFLWGKAVGVSQNLALLLIQPFLYFLGALFAGDVDLYPLPFLLIGVPMAAAFSIVQGVLCALGARTMTRGLVVALVFLTVEASFPICCLWTFSPAVFGYQAMIYGGPKAESAERVVFAIAVLISAGVHLVALTMLARTMKGSFDRFLGRIGERELRFDSRRVG